MHSRCIVLPLCLTAMFGGSFTATTLAATPAESTNPAISSMPLKKALHILARREHLQLIYVSRIASGVRVHGVPGGLSLPATLDALLDGTGLQFKFLTADTVKIYRKGARPAQQVPPPTHEAKPQTASSTQETTRLGTIIVTAQKRVQAAVDVPTNIETLSARAMRALNVRQLSQLDGYFANVGIIGGRGHYTQVNIRGVGSHSRIIGLDNRVGVYIDGVYVGQLAALNQSLLDVKRVEVLRGPQGTMFGANTIAGAINIITDRPTQEFNGRVALGAGRFNARQLTASISGALAPDVSGSLAVARTEDDGYRTNVFNGVKFGNQDNVSFRAALDANIGDRMNIYATADGMRDHGRGMYGRALSGPFGRKPATDNLSFYEVDKNDDGSRNYRDTSGLMLNAAYYLPGGATLKSITARRYLNEYQFYDLDATPIDLVFSSYKNRYTQYSEELQLISPDSGRLRYVFGLYLYHQNAASIRNVVGGTRGFLLGLGPGEGAFTHGTVQTTSYGLYGNMTYELTPQWILQAGLRASYGRKSAYYVIDTSDAPAFHLATGTFRNRIVTNNVNPLVTLKYKFGEKANIYAKFATGFKSGGFSMDFASAAAFPGNITLDPEQVKDYELGFKARILDGRGTVSASVFRERFLGYQLRQAVQVGTNALGVPTMIVVVKNAGKVQSQGVGLSGTLMAARGLQLRTSLGYDEATFTDYPNANLSGANYAGHRLPNAPELTGSVGIRYATQFGNGYSAAVRLRYSYKSMKYDTPENTMTTMLGGRSIRFGYTPARGLLDASVQLSSPSGRWAIGLWGRNLTNKHYILDTDTAFLGALLRNPGLPRTYGLNVTFNFGA